MNKDMLLLAAGAMAGAMNALGGGGSFVSLPAMMLAGLDPVAANTSSTVALFPAGMVSAWGYRRHGVPPAALPAPLPALTGASLLGGALGAALLLVTPGILFQQMLPVLLLCATLALWLAPMLVHERARAWQPSARVATLLQCALGIYGGYYGGAMGLILLAAWSMLGLHDLKSLQGPRTLLVSAANAVAVIVFMVSGVVQWHACLAMLVGALAGGVIGTRLGVSLPARVIRALTLAIASLVTLAFFVRTYGWI